MRGSLAQESAKITSIVIVTYCSESTIEACLAGLVIHTPGVSEIICVDNNSSDATVDLIARFVARDQRVKLLQNDTNLGYAPALNIGATCATGEYIIMLNPDAIPYGTWFGPILAALEDKCVGAAGPLGDVVGGDMWIGHYLRHSVGDFAELSNWVARNFAGQRVDTKLLIGFCVAMRRSVFDEIGGLDDDLVLGADDLDLSWRLRLAGYKLLVCKDSFVHHRCGVSFASLEGSRKTELQRQSDLALKRKLERHYGSLTGISSQELWGCNIFEEALNRP